MKRFLRTLERISLAVEKPLARLVRDPRFNPLYHTGTITVFLLLIILVTGVYLTMFYQFGFAGSYRAVSNIQASLVGRVIRALHRYASDLAVILVLLHGWRTFFMDRFRGPRWLAWVTGIGLAAITWIIGITGYWLISDTRAQLLNETLVRLLGGMQAGADFLRNFLATDTRGAGWRLTFIMMALHLGLSAVIGLVYWYHIRRLSRPKWLPPRFWLALVGAPLLLAAIIVPLGMLPPLDPLRLPGPVNLDAFYLFYLPAALRWPPLPLWGGLAILLVLSAALPWLLGRQPAPPVAVNTDRCTGCTLCAADCPYKAITMKQREEGAKYKYLAAVNPKLCVGCGICIGACDPLALSLHNRPVEWLWDEVVARAGIRSEGQPVKLLFTCERHWSQRPAEMGSEVAVIPLTCVGMALPDLVERGLAAGAAEVQIVGCPPEDCANREGNLWLQRRLERMRLPKLGRAYVDAPITTDWLPPNDFRKALGAQTHQTAATSYDLKPGRAHLRNLAAAAGIMLALLAVTVALSRVPFRPYPASGGLIEIALKHSAGQPIRSEASGQIVLPASDGAQGPVRLALEVDGEAVWEETYAGGTAEVFEQIALAPDAATGAPPDVRHAGPDRATRVERSGRLAGRRSRSCRSASTTRASAATRRPAGSCSSRAHRGSTPAAPSVIRWSRGCGSWDRRWPAWGPRATTRVAGMSAQEYLHQSIVDPDAYVVDGFAKGQMLRDSAQRLTEEQIQDLVAFLMTLR